MMEAFLDVSDMNRRLARQRRHLAAVIGRGLEVAADDPTPEVSDATVGFADIAGFTRLVRILADEELVVEVGVVPMGTASWIRFNLGFKSPFAGG